MAYFFQPDKYSIAALVWMAVGVRGHVGGWVVEMEDMPIPFLSMTWASCPHLRPVYSSSIEQWQGVCVQLPPKRTFWGRCFMWVLCDSQLCTWVFRWRLNEM